MNYLKQAKQWIKDRLDEVTDLFETPNALPASTKMLATSPPPPSLAPVTYNGTIPTHHILIVDASVSMGSHDWKPTRLGAAKDAALAYVQQLSNPTDPGTYPDTAKGCGRKTKVAVVAYGSYGKVMLPFTVVTNQSAIETAVNKICESGSTNMYAGIDKAKRLIKSNAANNTQVVLLTDGWNNAQCPIVLADALKQIAIVHGVGIGGKPKDVDEDLMKRLVSTSPEGKPCYRWIGDRSQLVQHFKRLAGGIRRL